MKQISGGALGTFLVLTFAVTWICFTTVAARAVLAHAPLGALLLLLGAFAPGLVALWLTARADGSTSVRALLGRTLQWRVAAPWYLFAVGYIAAIKLVVALVHRVAVRAWPRFCDEPWDLLPAAIIVSTPLQAGDERGWRGYALPRPTRRVGPA